MTTATTAASNHLLDLARRIADAYITLPGLRAFMVTGSTAEASSDFYSDLDMTAYYDVLPSEEAFAAARTSLGGSERVWLIGDRAEGGFAEAFVLEGIECQIGHITIETWAREMAEVLEKLNVDTPLHKAMEGTVKCIALYGEPLIEEWKAKLRAYPDALGRAMVERHLRFPAVWLIHDRLAVRDATIWHYQALVELAHNLLAVLAGLNRRYFTTFQFKGLRSFAQALSISPEKLADRIELLFGQDRRAAVDEAESLVRETLDLVDRHMPEVDTSGSRRRLGQRAEKWRIPQ
jgi:hypothetical protein